jgi:hypothetical protein
MDSRSRQYLLASDSGRTELMPCSKVLNPACQGENCEYIGRIGRIAQHEPDKALGTEYAAQRHEGENDCQ